MCAMKPEIRVVCRFRPQNADEVAADGAGSACVTYDQQRVEVLDSMDGTTTSLSATGRQNAAGGGGGEEQLSATTRSSSSTRRARPSSRPPTAPGSRSSSSQSREAALREHTLRDLSKTFTLDEVFGETTTQDQIFESVGQPLINNILKGYNATVLSYGQTGSGKTHTMSGPQGGIESYDPKSEVYPSRGLVPRVVQALFDELGQLDPAERTWELYLSVFEIYKEDIVDLLYNPRGNTAGSSSAASGGRPASSGRPRFQAAGAPPPPEYRIREDLVGDRGIYVENLEEIRVTGTAQVMHLIEGAMRSRKMAATNCNETSSRSHTLICLYLYQVDHTAAAAAVGAGGGGGTTINSRLNLVDLAGSEKVSKTQATGERLKEAQKINLSLTLLGNVIYKLTDGRSGYIPYRDSKLTRVLQDSLGGNSITTLMVHASVSMSNREETLSTLRFAQRAKRVKNKPRVNKEMSAKELKMQLVAAQQQILVLEQKLQVQNEMRQKALDKQREDLESEQNKAQRLIDSLMKEIEELRRELGLREEDIADKKKKIDFHKGKCREAEKKLEEERESTRKVEKTCKKLRKENESLAAQLAAMQKQWADDRQEQQEQAARDARERDAMTEALEKLRKANQELVDAQARALADEANCPTCGRSRRTPETADAATLTGDGSIPNCTVAIQTEAEEEDGGECVDGPQEGQDLLQLPTRVLSADEVLRTIAAANDLVLSGLRQRGGGAEQHNVGDLSGFASLSSQSALSSASDAQESEERKQYAATVLMRVLHDMRASLAEAEEEEGGLSDEDRQLAKALATAERMLRAYVLQEHTAETEAAAEALAAAAAAAAAAGSTSAGTATDIAETHSHGEQAGVETKEVAVGGDDEAIASDRVANEDEEEEAKSVSEHKSKATACDDDDSSLDPQVQALYELLCGLAPAEGVALHRRLAEEAKDTDACSDDMVNDADTAAATEDPKAASADTAALVEALRRLFGTAAADGHAAHADSEDTDGEKNAALTQDAVQKLDEILSQYKTLNAAQRKALLAQLARKAAVSDASPSDFEVLATYTQKSLETSSNSGMIQSNRNVSVLSNDGHSGVLHSLHASSFRSPTAFLTAVGAFELDNALSMVSDAIGGRSASHNVSGDCADDSGDILHNDDEAAAAAAATAAGADASAYPSPPISQQMHGAAFRHAFIAGQRQEAVAARLQQLGKAFAKAHTRQMETSGQATRRHDYRESLLSSDSGAAVSTLLGGDAALLATLLAAKEALGSHADEDNKNGSSSSALVRNRRVAAAGALRRVTEECAALGGDGSVLQRLTAARLRPCSGALAALSDDTGNPNEKVDGEGTSNAEDTVLRAIEAVLADYASSLPKTESAAAAAKAATTTASSGTQRLSPAEILAMEDEVAEAERDTVPKQNSKTMEEVARLGADGCTQLEFALRRLASGGGVAAGSANPSFALNSQLFAEARDVLSALQACAVCTAADTIEETDMRAALADGDVLEAMRTLQEVLETDMLGGSGAAGLDINGAEAGVLVAFTPPSKESRDSISASSPIEVPHTARGGTVQILDGAEDHDGGGATAVAADVAAELNAAANEETNPASASQDPMYIHTSLLITRDSAEASARDRENSIFGTSASNSSRRRSSRSVSAAGTVLSGRRLSAVRYECQKIATCCAETQTDVAGDIVAVPAAAHTEMAELQARCQDAVADMMRALGMAADDAAALAAGSAHDEALRRRSTFIAHAVLSAGGDDDGSGSGSSDKGGEAGEEAGRDRDRVAESLAQNRLTLESLRRVKQEVCYYKTAVEPALRRQVDHLTGQMDSINAAVQDMRGFVEQTAAAEAKVMRELEAEDKAATATDSDVHHGSSSGNQAHATTTTNPLLTPPIGANTAAAGYGVPRLNFGSIPARPPTAPPSTRSAEHDGGSRAASSRPMTGSVVATASAAPRLCPSSPVPDAAAAALYLVSAPGSARSMPDAFRERVHDGARANLDLFTFPVDPSSSELFAAAGTPRGGAAGSGSNKENGAIVTASSGGSGKGLGLRQGGSVNLAGGGTGDGKGKASSDKTSTSGGGGGVGALSGEELTFGGAPSHVYDALKLTFTWIKEHYAKYATLHQRYRDARAQCRKMQELLERAGEASDNQRQELDALRVQLSTAKRERKAAAKELERFKQQCRCWQQDTGGGAAVYANPIVQQQPQHDSAPARERSPTGPFAGIDTTAEQLEFCEMAVAELEIKALDFLQIESELQKAVMFRDPSLREKKRRRLIKEMNAIDRFCDKMERRLQSRVRFNTANLETQRLNLLQGAVELHERVAVTRADTERLIAFGDGDDTDHHQHQQQHLQPTRNDGGSSNANSNPSASSSIERSAVTFTA